MPIFGARSVPAQAKIGLAVLLSLIVLPMHQGPIAPAPTDLLLFAAAVGSEVLVGVVVGIGVSLVFQALEMGASLIGVQIGFSFGQLIDPLSGGQTGVLEQFYRVLATLVFFSINGHYLVIAGLLHTFEVVPPGSADLTLIAGERVVPFFTALFGIAVRVALPVTAALLLTDVALGIVERAVPQMNVLVVGMPLKVGVGVFVIALTIPLLTALMGAVFGDALVSATAFVGP
jgi:flagellar biosynthetic protein FliR